MGLVGVANVKIRDLKKFLFVFGSFPIDDDYIRCGATTF